MARRPTLPPDLTDLDLPSDQDIREETRRVLIRQATEQQWQDPSIRSAREQGLQKAYQDPAKRQGQAQKFLGRTHDADTCERLRQINTGKKRRGEAWIAGMAQKKLGNGHHNKPFVTPSGAFASRRQAVDWATEQGLVNALGKFERWVKTRPTEFYYITPDEFAALPKKLYRTNMEWLQNSSRTQSGQQANITRKKGPA